jgi:hypothetical protein
LDSITNKPVWTNISGDLPPGLPVNMLAVDPANPDAVFFAGTDFGLYYTIDSGKTWQKDYRLPNVAVHEIKMREDRTLFAFTHGRGMFAIQLKAPKVGVKNNLTRLSVKVYPNPSNQGFNVSSAMNLSGSSYAVVDLMGRTVISGTLGDDGAIDTRELVNGNYFLKISGGTGTTRSFTTKFIVQH